MPKRPPKPGPISEQVTINPDLLSLIPKEYLAAIGRVAAAWATLDFQLDQAIWQLAMTPHMLGACVTTQVQSTPSRLRALGALMRLHDAKEEHIEFLNKFEQRTHALALKRNRAVHDPIVIGQETGTVYRMTAAIAGKELAFGMLPSFPRELSDDFEQIKSHVVQFLEFWQGVSPEFEASRQTAPLSLNQIASSNSTTIPRSASDPAAIISCVILMSSTPEFSVDSAPADPAQVAIITSGTSSA